MSYEPSGLSGHHAGELNRGYPNTGNSFNPSSIINGGHTSTPNEVERKRNYKLLIDPVLKGRGHQKIYRFDGDFEGQPPVIPKDPRSRRTRLWSTRTKADLPVPKFKIDKFYVGIPPQRDIILNGLNDNVDRKFLHQLCEKFGNIEGIKIFYDPLTKRHLGKARVGFTTSASAKLAVAKLDATSIMGCIVHADLEHKVEIKPQVKTQVSQHGTNAVGKTPPSLERITGHHMLPTPPPSASSHSPANSTPSTPGSLGLTDPRTRGHSTSSASTEKLQSASPSVWPRNTVHQSNQSTCKGPVFEPISPPCEKIALPPPPPPDIPPPSLPSKRRTSSSPVSSGMRQPHLQDPGDRCQDTALKHGKDVKGYNNRSVWESCKTNRQSDKEFEWRRRDRDADRNRSEHSLFRSRWSTDKKGNDFYPEKDLRYSGSKDYTSRGRPGGETRDGLGRSELKKSTSRDDEGKRCRDSNSSCNSEKSEKGFKSRFADTSRSMNADGDQTKVGVHEKCKKSNIRSTTPVNEKSESVLKSTTSLNKDNVHTLQGAVSSSANALVNMSSSLENNATGTEKLLNADKLDREPFLSQDGLDLAGQNTKQESSSTSDNLKVHHDNLAERILGTNGRADGGGDVSQSRDLSRTNVTSAETISEQPTAGSGIHKDVSKVTDADAAEGASNLSMPEPEMKIESGQESLIKGDLGYYPVVEDISPVSSPTAAEASPCTYPTVVPDHSAMTSGDSQVVSTEDMPVNKEEKEITEDNDDAMSLSSISSNEETFEVTEPGSKPITVPPSVPFPPPFVPSVPPPPFIPPFDPTVPPPSITPITILPPPLPITVPPPTIPPPPIQTLAPPHPLVPPSFHPTFPPQFVSSLGVVPPPAAQGQYQTHPSGQVPSTHDQRPPMKKKWKAKISEEVLRIVSEELGVILKRDVNKRLVENSAFKALDGWWDNLGKSKLKMTTHQDYASTNQSSLLTTSGQNDMTSSPFFSTSMNQSEGLGIGLRASLPKMPSFRKRHQPSNGGSELYAKRRKEDSSSEAGSKTDLTGSDSETCSHKESGDSFQVKRRRAGDQLNSEDSCVSPWQQAEDSMDGPPATSVRTEEKHPTVGSSLYTNIYSSFSDSGSSMSEEESDSENSGEGQSEWDESEDSDVTSESASDYSSDEGPAKTSGDQTSEIVSGIPRTPPGTPPETPPETPPAISPIPRTPSITPPASPVDSQLSTIEEFPELEEPKVEEGQESMNMERYLESDVVTRDDLETITDSADYSSEQERVPGTPDLAMSVSEGDDKGLSRDETQNESLGDDIEDHSNQKEESASLEKTEFEENLTPSQLVDQPSLSTKETEDREISVTENKTPEQSYKPVVELPPEFPLRRYEQDDQLVCDFLISGLDYEDASYLKIGFENLVQVGSDSVANAHWAFHPTISAGVSTKGRKQKCDNIGVRIHSSGSARCEGYYKIGMAEKAKYLEAARRQLDRTQAVDNKKAEEKEANKAKQQSRENRALQRRLAASFQYEDFGDILKFNQLKVRKKKLTFRKSCIHDWGLFALEPIGPDEMVIEYVGEVVRQAIADDREKRYERCGIGSSYLFRVDSDTIIDATKYGNLARFINHCCEPNCYAKVVTLESEKKIVIYSKRDIAVNEEITYDYKFPIEEDKIPCLCGAPQCRGTLN